MNQKNTILKGFEASGVFWDDVCQRFAQVTPQKKWGVKLGNQLQYIKKTSWPRFCGNFQGLVDTWPWWNFDEFCCFRYEKKNSFLNRNTTLSWERSTYPFPSRYSWVEFFCSLSLSVGPGYVIVPGGYYKPCRATLPQKRKETIKEVD